MGLLAPKVHAREIFDNPLDPDASRTVYVILDAKGTPFWLADFQTEEDAKIAWYLFLSNLDVARLGRPDTEILPDYNDHKDS